MRDFIRRSGRNMIGFCGGAQIDKSSSGGTRAGNERFHKRSGRKMIGFRAGAQIEKSSPGSAKAGNERFHKEK